MVVISPSRLEHVYELLENVVDPDLPFLSISDIAILRRAEVSKSGAVIVTITPTYSGCPALGVIEEDIRRVLSEGGYRDVHVVVSHAPAWTTEWMSQGAKEKLIAHHIAPPGSLVSIVSEVLCPLCASADIETVSQFGSTACKSLMVCTNCLEPFDHFKAI